MTFREQPAEGGASRVLPTSSAGEGLRFREFYGALETEAESRSDILQYLRARPEEAIFWETPPCTMETQDRRFEFVCVPAPLLARCAANPHSFANQFEASPKEETSIVFENLGGDAVLVVPRPLPAGAEYTHLLAFLRQTCDDQAHEFLRMAGETFRTTQGVQPLWVSSAGMGVPWLHLRFDRRPKYYRFQEYRDPNWSN